MTEADADAVEVQMEPTTIALGEAVATGTTAASYVQNALERVEHLSEARTRYIKGVKGFYGHVWHVRYRERLYGDR